MVWRDHETPFRAWPVQVKGASTTSLELDRKYARWPGMLHLHVWGLQDGPVRLLGLLYSSFWHILNSRDLDRKTGTNFRASADPATGNYHRAPLGTDFEKWMSERFEIHGPEQLDRVARNAAALAEMPRCEPCSEPTVPAVVGMPDASAGRDAERGWVHLCGCVIERSGAPRSYCVACETHQ